MDEFNSLGNLKRFVSAFAFTAGYGMKGFLVMQGLDQLFKTYGKDNEILMNTSLQIYFSPNEDKTAAYLEKISATRLSLPNPFPIRANGLGKTFHGARFPVPL